MDSLAGATHDFYEEADDRRKRRRLIVGAVLAALVLAAAWFAFSMSKGDGAAGADGAAGTGAANVPTITVMVPGLQSVQTAIAANGSIAARREMPVGVVGEGGQVVSGLVGSEEHTSELQSLMRISYAVLCFEKKKLKT